MKIGFLVNRIETEHEAYTTTLLSVAAVNMGHEVWVMSVGDFVYDADGSIHAWGRCPPKSKYKSRERFLEDLKGYEARRERVPVDALDVLLLRNDPAEETERPWAQATPILFAQLASSHGVLVVNDPAHLAHAINKTYFQYFPEQVRPRTCISRNAEEIHRFVAQENGPVVMKPLQGSGGQSVFLVREGDRANLNQMIEAIVRDGYLVAQEYLPAAEEGDIRLFVMNGRPLEHEGKYAAFRRVNESGDLRSNMHVGGKSEKAHIDKRTLELVEMVRPKLVRDGMFLVGLDIVGDKLMEVNVFSPGGLYSAMQITGVDFSRLVIAELERKVQSREYHGSSLTNSELATL